MTMEQEEAIIRVIKTEIEPKIDEIVDEMGGKPDLMTVEETEELQRELSFLSPDDLLRQFTI